MNSVNTASVIDIFAAMIVKALEAKIKAVQMAWELSISLAMAKYRSITVSSAAIMDGNRAAQSVAPNSFIEAAWHQ